MRTRSQHRDLVDGELHPVGPALLEGHVEPRVVLGIRVDEEILAAEALEQTRLIQEVSRGLIEPLLCELLRGIETVPRAVSPRQGNGVLICDRDAKWSEPVRARLQEGGLRVIQTPSRSPNANAHAERSCAQSIRNVSIT